MSDIFDRISSKQLMDFSDNYETQFNVFESFFPSERTTAEAIKVTDYDVDYNPTALAVADNTIAPLAGFPEVDDRIMDMVTFKLEYQLSDSQIRKLQHASTEQEVQNAIRMIFKMEERLINAHYIARERIRAAALTTGKVEINENNFKPQPWDYLVPEDQKVNISLLEDDIITKGLIYNELINDRTKKVPAILVCTKAQLIKLGMNQKLVNKALGSVEGKDKTLTIEEVTRALNDYLGWSVRIIQDNNGNPYYWTGLDQKQNYFSDPDTLVLIPNIRLGATPIGDTAEENNLVTQDGINVKNEGGITVISNYEPRPVRYIMTSVSRFGVVYPKAPCSIIFKDTSKKLSELLKG